jgi:hypothetical protein
MKILPKDSMRLSDFNIDGCFCLTKRQVVPRDTVCVPLLIYSGLQNVRIVVIGIYDYTSTQQPQYARQISSPVTNYRAVNYKGQSIRINGAKTRRINTFVKQRAAIK